METIIKTEGLGKVYSNGEYIKVDALKNINFEVNTSDFVAVMGSSGSGKSTLMNILGCLDKPTSGKYFLDGIDVSSMKKNKYADIRNSKIGFVFQGFNLLPRTTLLENVMLPLHYDRSGRISDHRKAALDALERVGLSDRIKHDPGRISGGQQQRVAIARALVNQPTLILADEPTGNLDTSTSDEIMNLFTELNEQGITIVMVTHELDIASRAKRRIIMRDGIIINDENRS